MASAPLDVLVVGGGITGAGVAADAALRGLRVGLVERDDFACGTSSRSSKLVHGGLRYLPYGDVGLVREALRERRLLQQRAPHLVRRLAMTLPVFGPAIGSMSWQRAKIGAGLWAYDLLGAWRAGSRHRWLGLDGVLDNLPNITRDGLVGGLAYEDSQADDVRLVMANLRTAAMHGALVCNGASVTRLIESSGRVDGAVVVSDAAAGGEVELRARVVVNAAGVWAGGIFDGIGRDPGFTMLPSKGIHLTVRRDVAGIETGVAFFSQSGNANVFLAPWDEELAFVGTSDTPYDGDLASPEATEHEVMTLLGEVNRFLQRPLGRDDVVSTWAGLRPLVRDARATGGRSRDVSRSHRMVESPGLVTMVGGKLTTYRQMAEEVVDAAVRQLDKLTGSRSRGSASSCTTRTGMLDGAGLGSSPKLVDDLALRMEVGWQTARHLVARYGANCDVIAGLCDRNRNLRDQLHPERPDIAAEVVYAARFEMARTADDVLTRRTRLAIETRDGGEQARARIQELLAATS